MPKLKGKTCDETAVNEQSEDSETLKEDKDSETSASSSSEDEDEDPQELAGTFNKTFFKTLSSLKSKDPSIYDSSVTFFNAEETGSVKKKPKAPSEKPFLLRDYETDLLIKNHQNSGERDEDSSEEGHATTIVEGERKIRDEIKNFLNDDSENENDEGEDLGMGLLKKRIKTKEEKEKEDADYVEWLKGQKDVLEDKTVESELLPLHDYWNNKNLDKNEEFLKDFILNKRFLEKDSDSDDKSLNLSEDERILDEQEEFEQNYNFRYEEVTDSKRYPRQVENSLRCKDDRRNKKRAEIKERKKLEKEKKKEEIKKNQKEKLKEIEQKLEELKRLTGNEQCGFSEADILEDFDPEEHDKAMSKFYNDDFYNGTEEEKPDLSGLDFGDGWEEDGGEADGEMNYKEENIHQDSEFNMDCEAVDEKRTKKSKMSRRKRKKELKKAGVAATSQLQQLPKAVYDPEIHGSFQKYIDEYYNLDCEDFIDDLPCKFKYKPVQANDYGLTVDEILMADDKELNKWCPMSKLYKKRSQHVETNEVKIYKQKAQDVNLKAKILPSLFKSDEADDAADSDNANTDDGIDSSKEQLSKNEEEEPETPNISAQSKTQKTGTGKSPLHNVRKAPFKHKQKYSNTRLNAYGIKPNKSGRNKSGKNNRR